jgi:AraC-like DNA-binding protein
MTLRQEHARQEPADAAPHRDRAAAILPRGIKKATCFIDANLDLPIRLADLIAASGLAGRSLFKQFSDFVGTPPMAYVKARRLERIREELLRGETDSVTASALRWGITHLGRFAGEYFRMFGELPSATLNRARQALPPNRDRP